MSKQATQRLEPPVKHSKLNLQKVAPYIFVAPFLIYFLVFFLYPICETFWTSLCQQTGFAPPKFAGFANYKLLVIFCCWKWMGVNIVYYMSALQTIPK